MLDPTRHSASAPAQHGQAANRPVFRMITNDRMGGSVPAWVPPESAQAATLATLERAENRADKPDSFTTEMSNALAYHNDPAAATESETPFGFGDLIDIINPLQHIPLVNVLYRNITGDQIRSSTAVIGDTLFGGLAGAAGGLANLIMKEESGRDFSEHALQIVQGDPSPAAETTEFAASDASPLTRLANAENPSAPPSSALSFLEMTYSTPQQTTATINTSHAAAAARVAAMYKFNA